MSDILSRILDTKKQEISAAMRLVSSDALLQQAIRNNLDENLKPRGFSRSLINTVASGKPGIIAEIKKASPSKGILREQFHPKEIAESYAAHGATCLSVLTDKDYFMGSPEFLKEARAACSLPVIRKDFIIDPYQVYEARVAHADAILLIAECLDDAQLREMTDIASELKLSVLIEVHDEENLRRVAPLITPGTRRLLGVNNRDLRTMKVDLNHSFSMLKLAPHPDLFVSESGIRTNDDVRRLRDAGVRTVLVGEHLMREKDPGEALRLLLAADHADSR